ncbi:MAG TPA: thiol-disulfide oxidoreductase DCC family protein [Saprospiraceae bacterium]|nr:thiol-disulfide oxidoreductase DCC family protein [Saprospiraceae bacterium]HND87341.1 thiol-disulfide oxidoreductase DCC family protein [Saprospiraceae bacterium]HNG88695.1 thiol-disulfide oxidoreductase DCC family protein [Saprospiraceae bacterium]
MNSEINFPILLFDGVCNLCNHSVQWVLERDTRAQFRFAALQSDLGRSLLERFGLDPERLDTVVLIDGGQAYTRSDAPLELLRRLGGVWACLYPLKALPRTLRNAVYDWVARNRYRWFGRREACMLPRKEWKERFL